MSTQPECPVALTPRGAIAEFRRAALYANRAIAQIHQAARDGSQSNMVDGFRRLNKSLELIRELWPLVREFAELASTGPVEAGGMVRSSFHRLIADYSCDLWKGMMQPGPFIRGTEAEVEGRIRTKGMRCVAAFVSPILGAGCNPFSFDPADIARTFPAVAEAVRAFKPMEPDRIAAAFELESARAYALAEAAERADALVREAEPDRRADAGEATKKDPANRLKEPSPEAFLAYHYWTGGRSQYAVARKLSQEFMERGKQSRNICQGQVSKMCKEVTKWLGAGNGLPDLRPGKLIPTDPSILDKCSRTKENHARSKSVL